MYEERGSQLTTQHISTGMVRLDRQVTTDELETICKMVMIWPMKSSTETWLSQSMLNTGFKTALNYELKKAVHVLLVAHLEMLFSENTMKLVHQWTKYVKK